ncbi:lipopolysaccharide assembly protein LapA domain-containing protein [Solibacillus sp. FSL W7-1436]|uniref:LapA family protein n=1 Tax=Solibacillus sp. FSL W7-1436 TaxID=2921705 RepID=UPI0030F5B936
MKIQWTLVVGLIFAIIIAIFATVNVDSVQVNYVFGEARWPLILIILGSVLTGFIISFCFSAFRMYGVKRQTKAVRKELEASQVLINEKDAEIVRLKNELRERGASAFVTEEVPDYENMPQKKTKRDAD